MTIDRRRTAGAAVLALLALTATGCGGDASAEGEDGEAAGGGGFSRIINVEVTEVEPERFVEAIRLTGTVEANRDVVVSAEESGVVREVLAEKGSRVAAGQPLLKIDDAILRSQVAQAQAQASLAEETWQRRKRLWEEDAVGSELAYLEAKYAAEQAAANLTTLRERLERTTVRAAIEGVLEDRSVEVGTMVSPGAPVARIVDLNPVKIAAGVPERYAADIVRGSEAFVTFDVLEGERYEGTISFVGSTVDPDSRTFPVEFTLPNPDRAIKPEMVAEMELTRRILDDVLVVPQDALVRVEDGYVVFVIEEGPEGPVARSHTVVLGPSARNEVVIEEGIAAGDRLVVVGQQQVAAGDRVRIVGER